MFADWSGWYSSRVVVLLTAALGAWLLLGPGGASAQQGAIAGTIVDADALNPVAGAQVFIPGTVVGTLSGEQGTYRMEGVPVGQVTVTVRLIGYKEASQTVTVEAGQITTLDFQVAQTALRLQDIVVTGLAGATPIVKLPFTVERFSAEDLPVPAFNMGGLISGKLAGVQVVSSSGQPGSQVDVLLRGPTSINSVGRDQGPLVVIDGVIQSTGASLADINALDLESVEIVKGAAAASLYGSRAQNGVIQVKTKRGSRMTAGTFDVVLRSEYGISDLEREWPGRQFHILRMNDSQTSYVNSDGNDVPYGSEVVTEAAGPFAFQDNPFVGGQNNFGKFFDPGETFSSYGALSGAYGQTNFRVSAEYFTEQGVIFLKDGFDRVNARMNLDTRLGDQFNIAASGFVSRSESDGSAAFFNILFMSPGVDVGRKTVGGQRNNAECTGGAGDDCWFVVDPDPAVSRQNPLFSEQRSPGPFTEKKRTMGSLDLTWEPVSFLSLEGNFSYDRTDRNTRVHTLKNAPTSEGGARERGFLSQNDFVQEAINVSVTASFNKSYFDEALTTRTKARYLSEQQQTDFFSSGGTDIVVQGVNTLTGLVDKTTFSLRSSATEIKAQGFFFITSWDYKGRYIVDGLVRRDGSSLFGPDERWQTYWRGSAAWRVSQEPWFNVGPIDELKLRASIGTAGGRPNFFAQFETFAIGAGGTLTFNTLGNTALKPEFSREQELGVNLVLFDRIALDGTYSFQETQDQLLQVPLPAAFGFGEQWQNAGTLEAKTWELSASASIIDNQDVTWTSRVSWDRMRQRITRLDVPAYKFGPTTQTGPNAFFARVGEEVGAFYGTVWAANCSDLQSTFGIGASDCATNFDVNDDGYLVFVGSGNSFQSGPGADGSVQTSDDLWGTTGTVAGQSFDWGRPLPTTRVDPFCVEFEGKTEAECTTDFLRMGSSTPDWSLKLSNNFRYKGLRLYALLDAVIGFEVYNQSRQWATAPENSGSGTTVVDQAGKAEGLKKPIAYYDNWVYNGNNFNNFFVEDGTFLKLREVALSYTLPSGFLESAFRGVIDRATLSVIGRNILTISDYSGYDPEVGFGAGTGSTGQTGSATLTRFDAFTYPNFRTFTAALELVF